MPPQAPLPQQPRAQAGGIADLFAALQGGGNSSLYDQMAPPPTEAGPSPYADFQYLLDTPVDQRGFGYVPPVDEAYGVDLGPIDPSDIETRTPEELNEPMDIFDEPVTVSAPVPEIMEVTVPETIVSDPIIPDGTPIIPDNLGDDIQYPDPVLEPIIDDFIVPERLMPNPIETGPVRGGPAPIPVIPPTGPVGPIINEYPDGFPLPKPMAPAPYDDSGPIRGEPRGRRFSPLIGPDMQARIDEMRAKVEANKTAPAASPAMTLSPEQLADLQERIGSLDLGSFGNFNLGNFNIPAQAVEPVAAPAVAPAVTPEALMAQMPNNPFIGNFDREALMARIEAMRAQNAPAKMAGPRTISDGGRTIKAGAPAPTPMPRSRPDDRGVNSMLRGRR